MADSFVLQISTPEKEFYKGDCESLIIKTIEGEMGILPGHMLMVVALDIAPIRFKAKDDDEWFEAAVLGGFAQIKGDHVDILADTAEWPEDIEVARAMEAKRRAEERLQSHTNDVEYYRSELAKRRALARLQVVNRI